MCILLLWGEMLLRLSIKTILSSVSFKAAVSLLIFCQEVLSIEVKGVLKSPTMTVFLSISPFMSFMSIVLHISTLPCWVRKCLLGLYPLVGLFPLSLCSVLCLLLQPWFLSLCMSDISIATPAFFPPLPICMKYLFPPLYF